MGGGFPVFRQMEISERPVCPRFIRVPGLCLCLPQKPDTGIFLPMRGAPNLVWIIIAIVAAITSWILGMRMRRRIKRALGVDVQSESELTSINTWMKVADAEERSKGGRLQ